MSTLRSCETSSTGADRVSSCARSLRQLPRWWESFTLKNSCSVILLPALLVFSTIVGPATGFDREDHEVAAGSSFSVLLNPTDKVYGVAFETATRLKGTPVVGNYFVSMFQNSIEDSLYSGLGMTIRLLPEWRFQPIIGGGGSFNYCWSAAGGGSEIVGIPSQVMSDVPDRESYFAAHVEAGIRVRITPQMRFVEVTGRYTWNLSDDGSDYWLLVLSTGFGK